MRLNVQTKIMENLNHKLKLAYLPHDVVLSLLEGKSINLSRCVDCGEYIPLKDVKVRAGKLYCSNCNSRELESIGSVDKYDFEDYSLFEKSEWKHLSGKKYRYMDEGYEKLIKNKLFPLLREYGLTVLDRPKVDSPYKQTYQCYGKNDELIQITFYGQHTDKDNYREGKLDMLVSVYYNGKEEEAGVIDLSNEDNINSAFEIITMALEKLGFSVEDKEKEQEVDNPDIDKLVNFKNTLSEAELLEIEK